MTELKGFSKKWYDCLFEKDALKLDEIIVKSGLVSKSYLNSTNSLNFNKAR